MALSDAMVQSMGMGRVFKVGPAVEARRSSRHCICD